MNMYALITRISFVALLGAVAVAGLIHNRQIERKHPLATTPVAITITENAASPAASSIASASKSMLPTITLATVSVRPSAAEIAAAMQGIDADTDADTDLHTSETATITPLATLHVHERITTPRLRLDMPYYSFGKVLRRVDKE